MMELLSVQCLQLDDVFPILWPAVCCVNVVFKDSFGGSTF